MNNITETISELHALLLKNKRISEVLHESKNLQLIGWSEYTMKMADNEKNKDDILAKLQKSLENSKCTHHNFTIEYGGEDGANMKQEDINIIKCVYGENGGRVDAYEKCNCCKKFISITRTLCP